MEKYADESGGDTFKAHGDRTHGKNRKAETFDTKAFHARYVPRMESYTNVIHAKNLEIGYDTVLSKVSFLLQKKDRLAIIGENGKVKIHTLKT